MKDKWERSSQVRHLREHPIHRCAVPLPQWGRLRYESIAFLALSEQIHAYVEKNNINGQSLPRWGRQRGGGLAAKRKPTPPRCARQPLPREGAREVISSFLWKEVPRRGGDWMGMPLSPKQSLPRGRWGAVSILSVKFYSVGEFFQKQ